jgi:hypothetical protein
MCGRSSLTGMPSIVLDFTPMKLDALHHLHGEAAAELVALLPALLDLNLKGES